MTAPLALLTSISAGTKIYAGLLNVGSVPKTMNGQGKKGVGRAIFK